MPATSWVAGVVSLAAFAAVITAARQLPASLRPGKLMSMAHQPQVAQSPTSPPTFLRSFHKYGDCFPGTCLNSACSLTLFFLTLSPVQLPHTCS